MREISTWEIDAAKEELFPLRVDVRLVIRSAEEPLKLTIVVSTWEIEDAIEELALLKLEERVSIFWANDDEDVVRLVFILFILESRDELASSKLVLSVNTRSAKDEDTVTNTVSAFCINAAIDALFSLRLIAAATVEILLANEEEISENVELFSATVADKDALAKSILLDSSCETNAADELFVVIVSRTNCIVDSNEDETELSDD